MEGVMPFYFWDGQKWTFWKDVTNENILWNVILMQW